MARTRDPRAAFPPPSSGAPPAPSAPDQTVLIVRSGERRCALPVAHVAETLRPLPAEPLPEGPAFLRGLALYRGAPTPVVDLARLFGDGDKPPARQVALRLGERRALLAVEEVRGLRTLSPEDLRDLPPLAQSGGAALAAAGRLDDRLLLLLQAARLLPEQAGTTWS